MRLNTPGLIIRENTTGECDRIVTILTREVGVVRAFVRGGKNIKSRLHSSTQLLCYSTLSLYQGRDAYIIDEAQSIEVFFSLRENIEHLALAQYFCELAGELAPQQDMAANELQLMLNTLHMLTKNKRTPTQLKAIFELRMMVLCGYMPDLLVCSKCGDFKEEHMLFDERGGVILCDSCRDNSPATPISNAVLSAMRHICYAPMEKLFSFSLPDDSLKKLAQLTQSYTIQNIQRRFKTLEFYNSLF